MTIKPIPPATPQHVLPPNLDHEYFEDGARHPFRHDAGGFELVNAWWLAEAALLTYAPVEFASQQFRNAGWTIDDDQPFSGASTLCYVAHSPDAVIVAFRGTRVLKPGTAPSLAALREVVADISTDGRVTLIESGHGGVVHCGFHAALEQIWAAALQPCLTRLKAASPARTIWLTGHSLGGALATLAAARLAGVTGLYTFGSPRVGDRQFAERCPDRAYRVVNNNDIVPHVPRVGPSAIPPLFRTYEHVGRLKYIAGDGAVQDNPSRWSRLTDGFHSRYGQLLGRGKRLRSGWQLELPDDGFNDHGPLFYALRLWNAYARAQTGSR